MFRAAYIPYFKISPTILCCFIFLEECLNPQVRRSISYYASPSEFISRYTLLYFYELIRGLSLENISWFFFSNLYILPWLTKIFQIHGVKITGKYIESKHWICSFLLMSSSKTITPAFYHHYSRQKEIIHFPQTNFFEYLFFPSREGGSYGVEYMTKIKLKRYWS